MSIKFEDVGIANIKSNDRELIEIYTSEGTIILTQFQALLLADRLEYLVRGHATFSGGERVIDQGGTKCHCGAGELQTFYKYDKLHYENYYQKSGNEGVFCSSCSSYFPRYVVEDVKDDV